MSNFARLRTVSELGTVQGSLVLLYQVGVVSKVKVELAASRMQK